MAKAITSSTPSPLTFSSSNNTSMATACSTPCNRRKIVQSSFTRHTLLPGLPNHIAELCLFKVNPSLLYSVCRAWRQLVYSPSFPPCLSLYAMLAPTGTSSTPQQFDQGISDKIEFFTFDPVVSKWRALPSPLSDQPLTFLIRHPSFLSRNFPIQTVSVAGNLILLAGTAHNFFPAISRPLIFNPISGRWSFGPTLLAPRRWCAAGASAGSLYVASGMGAQFSPDVARSVEKWDLNGNSSPTKGRDNYSSAQWNWQKLSDLKDCRFSRDAIDAVGWRGKLCMVNIKGGVLREGVVYDIESDKWHEMAEGMIRGWTGPVAAMDEDVMYAVDIASGALRKYDPDRDTWYHVMLSVHLRGAQQIAAAGKRVCAVCDGGASIAVVDVESAPPRLWLLDNPGGFQALGVHILPRMSGPNFVEEEL